MALTLTLYKKGKESVGKVLIVLVHGLGAAETTWVCGKKTWTDLLLNDPNLPDTDVAIVKYDTAHVAMGLLNAMGINSLKIGWFRRVSIGKGPFTDLKILSQELKRELNTNRSKEYEKIIIVGHSMGGLIGIRYILEELEHCGKLNVKGFISLATPYNGSNKAFYNSLFKTIHEHAQIPSLEPNSIFLDNTIRLWQKHKDSINFKYVFCFGTNDTWVSQESSVPHIVSSKWKYSTPLPGDHSSILNVDSHDSPTYRVVSEAIQDMIAEAKQFGKKRFDQQEHFLKNIRGGLRTKESDAVLGQKSGSINIEFEERNSLQGNDKWFYLRDKDYDYENGIVHDDIKDDLSEKLKAYNVVAVEGIKGSGKEYFIESYFKLEKRDDNVLLYCGENGETIDDFLLNLESEFKLHERIGLRRFKEFLELLAIKNTTLVINKFHKFNKESFISFIDYATHYKSKVNIILLSDTSVECSSELNKIGRIKARGFNKEELKKYIEMQQVDIKGDINIGRLLKKTGGNPFAISIFCHMVKNLGFGVQSLLKDKLSDNSEIIKSWIKKIESLLTHEELILLRILSLCENPFNQNLSNYIIVGLNRQYKDRETIPKTTFSGLLKKYLVQKVSNYRWSISEIIAEFFRNSFTDKALKQLGHELLGNYYLQNYRLERNYQNDEAKKLNWLLQACHQFQLAEKYDKSEVTINNIRKIVNKNGYYEAYARICENEMKNNKECSNWIVYNLAHCYLIMGRVDLAERTLKKTIENQGSLCEENAKLSIIRLYAETLNEKGLAKQGLKRLREEMKAIRTENIKQHVLDHAKQIEACLLTEVEEYDESIKICDELISRQDNVYSKTVALTRKGIIYKKRNLFANSIKVLSKAAEGFEKICDKRGQAWALSHLGTVLIKSGIDIEKGYEVIEKAIDLKIEIGESSRDYKDVIIEWMSIDLTNKINTKINEELERLQVNLDKASNT